MNRYKSIVLVLFTLLMAWTSIAQVKVERQHRIKKNQFPQVAHEFIKEKLKDVKNIRFYKETDTSKVSYEAKFKKDKLFYGLGFDEYGKLQDIVIIINILDIPKQTWTNITLVLKEKFSKYKVRQMQQRYPVTSNQNIDITLKNAFQNLMIPSINYELLVSGKIDDERMDYELLFSANGDFVRMKESLPANYDHVLY